MKNNYEIVKDTARKLLDISLENNHLDYFLLGSGIYAIKVRDDMGEKINSVDAIMQAIYSKYLKDPDSNINNKFFETLDEVVSEYKGGNALLTALSEIEYQLRAQRDGYAPFKIDCGYLILKLKENIYKNKEEFYERPVKELNLVRGFIEKFEEHDELLQKAYGYKIL